jgi:hypothetical protein
MVEGQVAMEHLAVRVVAAAVEWAEVAEEESMA